jgi:hypothetical protein
MKCRNKGFLGPNKQDNDHSPSIDHGLSRLALKETGINLQSA